MRSEPLRRSSTAVAGLRQHWSLVTGLDQAEFGQNAHVLVADR